MTPDGEEYCLITGDELRSIGQFGGCTERCIDPLRQAVIVSVRSRPAPSRNILDTDLCVCGLTEQECQDKTNKSAAQAREDALKPISAIYERFKHLDDILSKRDPDCPMMLCYVDIWEAVKESLRRTGGDE